MSREAWVDYIADRRFVTLAPRGRSAPPTAPSSSLMATAASPSRPKAALGALKPLVPFALAYRGRIALALIALAVASVATLTLPLAVRRVVDRGFSESSGHILHAYFGMLLVVVAVLALASAARYYLVITLGERVVADLRAAVFRRLAALDPSYFDATQSGEIVSRLTADTTQVKSAFGVSISIALRNSFLFFGAIAMMMVTSLKLSVLVLLAIPVIVLPLILSGRGVRRRARLAQDRLADAAAYAAEAIGAVRTMFAFGMERATADRFAAAAEEAFAAARRSTKARAILTGTAIFLVSASVVGVLWYGAQDVLAGEMTPGRLSQFVLYAVFAASSLGQLSEVYGELAQAAGSAERLGEILAARPTIFAPAQARRMPEPPIGAVAFAGVHFAYPTRTRARGAARAQLPAPARRARGAGRPLGRRQDDGAAAPPALLRSLERARAHRRHPDDRRRSGGAAPAHGARAAGADDLRGTVLDNIRYGRPEASEEEVRRAARSLRRTGSSAPCRRATQRRSASAG